MVISAACSSSWNAANNCWAASNTAPTSTSLSKVTVMFSPSMSSMSTLATVISAALSSKASRKDALAASAGSASGNWAIIRLIATSTVSSPNVSFTLPVMLPSASVVASVLAKPSMVTSISSLVTTAFIAANSSASVVSLVAVNPANTPSTAVLASARVWAGTGNWLTGPTAALVFVPV